MNKETKQRNNKPWVCVILFLMTAGCITLSLLCLRNSGLSFFKKYTTLFSVVFSILLSLFCFLSIWCTLLNKESLSKTFISLLVFLLFILTVLLILQTTGFFEIVKDEQAFQNYLEKSGAWMPIIYIVLQYLQVVLLPIPSVVSTLAGVALFGAWKTLLYSYIGIWLGSITAFFIGRKLGNKAVAWMVGKESLEKWQKKLKRKDTLVLTTMFFLPIFPDDLFCFIAGLSTMTTGYFLVMITLSRLVSISATCFSLQLLPLNTWWGLMSWGIIAAVFIVLFIFIYKNMENIQDFLDKKFKRNKKKNK